MWDRRGAVRIGWLEVIQPVDGENDVDTALAFLIQAGTQIIDGGEFDGTQILELDSWLVSEWLNVLDSL